jgi:hypothetical protein
MNTSEKDVLDDAISIMRDEQRYAVISENVGRPHCLRCANTVISQLWLLEMARDSVKKLPVEAEELRQAVLNLAYAIVKL